MQDLEPIKDPLSYTWFTYAWVIFLSALGGFVSFARKVRAGQSSRPWGLAEFVGEIATAAFTGLLTFYFCEAARLSPLLTAAFVGISGHMGSRALFQFEMLGKSWLHKRFGFFKDSEL